MAVTAKEVAALREMTGVGMMECKKALVAAEGDMDKAIVILRERGLAAADKKSGRIASEGTVVSIVEGNLGCVLEVNSETDFAGKSDAFQAFAKTLAQTVIAGNPADVDSLLALKAIGTDMTVDELLKDRILVIGENIKIRRFTRLEGVLESYVHDGGSIGVMVKLATSLSADKTAECGANLAMQVAASNPLYTKREDVPADVIENEKDILKAQIANDPKMANKPAQIIEKMVEGRINKYYNQHCLVEQEFIIDDSINVAKYLENVSKELGAEVKVDCFVRYEKGEGLEKKVDNFADEVASMIK